MPSTDRNRNFEDDVLAVILDKLEVAGEIVESKAKTECPVDTGNLKGSIDHILSDEMGSGDHADGGRPGFKAKHFSPANVVDNSVGDELYVIVGANVEYAPFVEGRYKPFLQIALKTSLAKIKRLFER